MPSTWSFKVALAVVVTILGLTGPSQSVVIPLTNQPISHGGPSSQAAPGNSRNSNAALGSSFPAHDPFGRAKTYPGMAPLASSQPDRSGKRQTLQFTFQPALPQNYTPTSTSAAAAPAVLPTLKAAYTPPEPVSLATDPNRIIINPANIQWTAPDVPDEVSKAIIEQLRQKLGAEPVPLGELNNRLITFTTALPGVIINRTMITNVQETVLEEANNKSTRTMTSYKQGPPLNYQISTSSKTGGYDGHPSKTYVTYEQTTPINSLAYNPAAVYDSSRSAASPPQYNTGNDYQKSYSEQQYSYQVPSESSYQTNYYQPPPPQPQQQSYSKPPAQQGYQQDSPAYQAPAPKAYQKAPEPSAAYQKPQPQPQYQPPPPPKAPEYPKPKAAEPYQPPKAPESYHPQQQQQKKQQSYAPEENVKIIYKYIEVCNPEPFQKQSKSPPPQKPYSPTQKPPPAPAAGQYPNQKQANPYIEAALNQASQYPSTPEPLNLDLASTTNEAAGSAQDSQATLASVYGEIHRRMAELEQLQRYVSQIQAEAQQAAYVPIAIPPIYLPPMPSLTYGAASLIPAPISYPEAQAVPSSYYSPPISVPNYAQPPPPPKPVAPYSLPPAPAPPAPPAKPEYKQQPQPSYQAAPKPSYQGEPKASYNSQPYNGQQMTVQYHKTVEKVSSNSTSPAY